MSARILSINNETVILAITRDITQIEMSKNELQQSRDNLRLITDNMADVITQTDARIKVIYTSPSIERVFGYPPQNLLGKSGVEWILLVINLFKFFR